MDAGVLIAGGGCAGLSLALWLRRFGVTRPITLIDDDPGGHPHKLWSFWSEDPAQELPTEVPLRIWSRMRAAGPGWTRDSYLGELRYCTVRSEEFERAALEVLQADPDVRLVQQSVREVRSVPGGAVVATDGPSFEGRWAFNSCIRTPGPPPALPVWQSFGGLVIRSDPGAFDADTVTLMDFDVPQQDGPTFVYVLPFADDLALVEHTVFSTTRLSDAAHRDAALGIAAQRSIRVREVVREEYGAIPMFERRPGQRRGPNAFNIGTVGGMGKPTTGYAFLRIQQQARRLAHSLSLGSPEVLEQPAWRLRAYDTALLDVIVRSPQDATRAFESLFRNVEFGSVLRFLDERPTVRDELRIVFGALPWMPFLRSVPQAVRLTPRSVGSHALPEAKPELALGEALG